MTTPRVTVPVDVLRELIDASSEVRDLLANVPEMQDRKYVGTGNRFVNAIGAAHRSYLSAAPAPEGGAVAMIKALLDHIDRETCQHDNLKRGGFQWTICEDCDRKWADDQGGFKPYADAPPVAAARPYLEALAALQAEQKGGA